MRKLVFLIKVMNGGGAERVISLLANFFAEQGDEVTLVLTHQRTAEARTEALQKRIRVLSLENAPQRTRLRPWLWMSLARSWNKLTQLVQHRPSELAAIWKYKARNYGKYQQLKRLLKNKNAAIAFLYDSVFLTLLARNRTTRCIISERGDPRQSAASKTDHAFFHRMFYKADAVVFQSPDAEAWYEQNTRVRGTVIFNPVKADLPERYLGARQKKIVNFCRISKQKNLLLLIDAFSKLHMDHPEYDLGIYGDAAGNGAEGYLEKVRARIASYGLQDSVHISSGRADIHRVILDYAMFVSSSDFEGMSNSMLEAMAIGLPTVCTDCPAGGARAIIKDHENGLLTPVGDADALYLAMKEVIENPILAEKLSENGTKIKEQLSVEKITKEWMELIDGEG